jgi:hypothetical protein
MPESGLVAPRAPDSSVQPRSWPGAAALAHFSALFDARDARVRAQALELVLAVVIVAAGAVLRFWGLGAVGLHGDEKTMALPTMHLVQYGTPLLPSGILNARGNVQQYMMDGADELFGQSAWAFRLPSALCGILLIALTYLAGRRFLPRPWNLALTATVAFLPSFIEDAQTARMYVFLVTCVAGYVVLLLEWERTGREGWLAAAALALIVGIQFHQLAIFAAFLTLYPGLVRSDGRKLVAGVVAFAAIAVSFLLISRWIESFYPDIPTLPGTPPIPAGPRAAAAVPHPGAPLIAAAVVVAGGLAVWLWRALPRGALCVAPASLIAAVPLAQFLYAYHVAFLLAVAGLIASWRVLPVIRAAPTGSTGPPVDSGASQSGSARGLAALGRSRWVWRIGIMALLCTALLAVQITMLARSGVPLRQSAGLLLGWPSVWPLVAISRYSRFAALVVIAGAAFACWRLARRQAIPDFFLLLALGVWVPLLMIGLFKWDIPHRYAAAQIFPLLLGAFAAARWLWSLVTARWRTTARWQAAAAAAVAVLAINPVGLARAAGSGYGEHPDHLGAARFVLSQHLGPKDIVIAEDVIVQTYYLGHVDYWLIGKRTASQFVYWHDGQYEDFYTDAPIITTAKQLERLIARRDRGAIYIIGSGEEQADGRAYARGPSLERFLTSPSLRVVYVGRDGGLTKVWKIPPPQPTGGTAAGQRISRWASRTE